MKRKGFTLIELLVVIAIIGILATIGLVALNGAREKARDATRKSDLSQVKTALVLYADDNSAAYPAVDCISSTGDSVVGCIYNAQCGSLNATQKAANPICNEYISKAVADQTNSGSLVYDYEGCDKEVVSDNMSFFLYAGLESPENTFFWIASDGTSGDGATAVATTAARDALCL